MEPRVQYAQTKDGVSIAYSVMGAGPPLVYLPSVAFSNVQIEWRLPLHGRWYQQLAHGRTLIQYDARGLGLSERNVIGVSLPGLVLDLEAVVDSVDLESFALFAAFRFGPVAISYAVQHPERVSRLILFNTYARGTDIPRSPRHVAIWGLIDTDWELFTETFAHDVLGWPSGDQASQQAELMREGVTPEMFRGYEAIREADASSLLSQIQTPTLVLHRRHVVTDLSQGKELAARIKGARLVALEGDENQPFRGDSNAVLRAIDEFLSEGEATPGAAVPPTATGLVTILFTDMESSTALTQRLGDAKAQELVRTHNAIVREALKAHGGSEIKHTGDGIMASFPSASGALECAVAIQRAFEEQGDVPLRVRIGLNAGEPVVEEQDLFGTAVQLARRICDHGEAGQILASNVVRELAAGKGFLFSDIGEVVPKGFEDPVRLYEVPWREA